MLQCTYAHPFKCHCNRYRMFNHKCHITISKHFFNVPFNTETPRNITNTASNIKNEMKRIFCDFKYVIRWTYVIGIWYWFDIVNSSLPDLAMKKKKPLSPSVKRMVPKEIWKRRSSFVIIFIVDSGSSRNRKSVDKDVFIISKSLSSIIWMFISAFIELLLLLLLLGFI